MAEPTRTRLTFDEAVAMLPEGEKVHTFRQRALMLLGADWSRRAILAHIRRHGAELAGPMATGMGHGLLVHDDDGMLFVATRSGTAAPEE